MSDIGRASFIPKETAGMTPSKIRRKRTFHIFGFLATTLLVGSLLFAGGVYFLNSATNANLETAKKALNDQKSIFQMDSIAEVREFDRQLQAADLLLKNHIAPLKIFASLEEDTKQKLQFTAFKLEHTPSLETIVSLEGKTAEFNTLALQESQFTSNPLLRNIVFKEIAAVTEEGKAERTITFSLQGELDTSLVQFDGTPVFIPAPTEFIETNETLSVADSAPAVLGAAVTDNDI